MLLLQNARVIDPARGIDDIRDLAVMDGRMATLGTSPAVAARLDLSGYVVTPGLIDAHVHLREPGQEYKETIATATAAAAAGGFTSVLAMPNTDPPMDSVARVRDLMARARRHGRVRVLTCACLTRDRHGRELTDLAALKAETDIVGVSDDGSCVQDPAVMAAAAAAAAAHGLPVIDHCEDESSSGRGVVRSGPIAECLRVPGMPREAETRVVRRNVELARRTGAHIHMQHLSCRESVETVRRARRQGTRVSAEVTPHHLALTWDMLPIAGTNAKMNPPLGSEDDRQALLEGVADGTLTVIATDHAPHAPWEKARGLVDAPFGIIGLETALPLCLELLVHGGVMALSDVIARFTAGPAELLGLETGTLAPGCAADLTVIDVNAATTLDITTSRSKSRNSPFHNLRVHGRVVGAMARGEWVFDGGLPAAQAPGHCRCRGMSGA